MGAKQPNILIIWGDDIGMWNISWYSRGLMGYRTPSQTTTDSRAVLLDVQPSLPAKIHSAPA